MELSLPAEQEIAHMVVRAVREHLAAIPERASVQRANLEGAVEGALRDAGRSCLERAVQEVGTGSVGSTRPCGCGGEQESDH